MNCGFEQLLEKLNGGEGAAGAGVEAERVVFYEDRSALSVRLRSDRILPFGDVCAAEREISAAFPFVKDARISFSFHDLGLSPEETAVRYMPYIIAEIKDARGLIRTVDLDHYEKRDGSVVFEAVGRGVVEELNLNVSPKIEKMLGEVFGISVSVAFCECGESPDRLGEKHKADMAELEKASEAARKKNAENGAAERPKRQQNTGGRTQNGGRKRTYEGPVRGNVILGKKIEGAPLSVSDIPGNGPAVMEGSIFGTDVKETRGGRFIYTFNITDKTDSIKVKCFISEKKKADLDEYLGNGKYVRVAGSCEYDTFEKMTLFKAESIELAEAPGVRKDTAERKRVELHAHTRMSQIDGIMDVKAYVKRAKAWGHSALAITDHGVVQSFPDAADAAGDDIKILFGVEGYLVDAPELPDGTLDYKSNNSHHIILIAKNKTGLKNIYKLVSFSFVDYFYKKPRMPRSEIEKYREGIIIGSACEAGELFRALVAGASDEELERIASFYDYLEIQPRSNNYFMVENGKYSSVEDLLELNRRIVDLGIRTGKPVAATCDAHYLDPEDHIYRNIIMAGHGFTNLSEDPRLYLRTTDEMLEEFAYLGEELAEKVVIDDPQMIADMVEVIQPVAKGKFPPNIEGSEERLRERCYEKAHSMYGDPLPQLVEERLEKELTSVISNGYAVMYVAAEMLVQKSLSDGYLVGSRGSVGSSLAAMMDGITEVNPLPPHYLCPNCRNSEFILDGSYECGADMPEKVCPVCGTEYKRDGFNIPFETFLGFSGNKEPDIDLNFAGEYQPVAHKYVEEIFGSENVFKAGTINTIKEKTALGYVRKYCELTGKNVNPIEAERLAHGCEGTRKTSGQHPGGIVIVPEDHEIYEFTPVMHPSEGEVKDIITTHFDYHKIDSNLLKLDILGHDVPSMIRMLEDMTGIAPQDIPLSDPKVNDLFIGTDPLDIKIDDYAQRHGTFGIPEFGTSFTRQMLDDTQPEKFSALVRIAGFSHGTDVWINNAQEFIRSGDATMDDAIATRDDIMNYLIQKGVPKLEAFNIMEKVRKGKGVTQEREELMREHDVPEWYIESCKRIKYMFPKAHAVAYVMMSYRIAYFKVYYPLQFYAVYFTMKAYAFNADVILGGLKSVTAYMNLIDRKGKDAANKELEEYLVCEVAYEMYARGFEFLPARLGASDGMRFIVEDGRVRIPFRALDGIGETAAVSLMNAYKDAPFSSIEDMTGRTSLNSSNVETLRKHGVLKGIPESDQLSLFGF